MRLRVIGQAPGGPVLARDVTPEEFVAGWGLYAAYLLNNAVRQTLVKEGHRILVVRIA
jgi:hypothetical protein